MGGRTTPVVEATGRRVIPGREGTRAVVTSVREAVGRRSVSVRAAIDTGRRRSAVEAVGEGVGAMRVDAVESVQSVQSAQSGRVAIEAWCATAVKMAVHTMMCARRTARTVGEESRRHCYRARSGGDERSESRSDSCSSPTLSLYLSSLFFVPVPLVRSLFTLAISLLLFSSGIQLGLLLAMSG